MYLDVLLKTLLFFNGNTQTHTLHNIIILIRYIIIIVVSHYSIFF